MTTSRHSYVLSHSLKDNDYYCQDSERPLWKHWWCQLVSKSKYRFLARWRLPRFGCSLSEPLNVDGDLGRCCPPREHWPSVNEISWKQDVIKDFVPFWSLVLAFCWEEALVPAHSVIIHEAISGGGQQGLLPKLAPCWERMQHSILASKSTALLCETSVPRTFHYSDAKQANTTMHFTSARVITLKYV